MGICLSKRKLKTKIKGAAAGRNHCSSATPPTFPSEEEAVVKQVLTETPTVLPDWSAVRSALDVGCGRGILLNSVAGRLKKEGGGGRVVGLAPRRDAAVAALRRAWAEGVGEYVTCRDGDARCLPFPDGYFDVVVSAVHLSEIARGLSAAAAAERGRGLGELVRVLKPGGVGVVWDLVCAPEYAQRLREMRMEDVRVSERVTAYLVGSHIVSFRKPAASAADNYEWRAHIG